MIKQLYSKEFLLFKHIYKKSMFTVLFLGIGIGILCFFSAFWFEDFIIEQSMLIADQVGDIEETHSNSVLFWSIFGNNLMVGFIITLIGFIPIFALPMLIGFFSFASVGILAGYGQITGHNIFSTLLVAFVPHAVIEVIPILYSIAIGMYVNKNIIRKLFLKKKHSDQIRTLMNRMLTGFILIILPTFFLAALVEVFITTRLIDKLL